MKFYLDGALQKRPVKDEKEQKLYFNCNKAIGFIGNSKDGKCPFGAVADLRIYPYALTEKKINEIFSLLDNQDWESEMPDKFLTSFFREDKTLMKLNDIEINPHNKLN